MVAALIFSGALNDLDILGFFDNADGAAIAAGVSTDSADFLAGNIAANAAQDLVTATISVRIAARPKLRRGVSRKH